MKTTTTTTTRRPPVVIIETPYAGATDERVRRNLFYLRACLRDSLLRGEAPFASHGLYTQPGVLDDDDESARDLGIRAGLAIGARADFTAVYADLGVSSGMERGIQAAHDVSRPVVTRTLGPKVLNERWVSALLRGEADSLPRQRGWGTREGVPTDEHLRGLLANLPASEEVKP